LSSRNNMVIPHISSRRHICHRSLPVNTGTEL
jgi:hypothetical protein